MNGQNLGLFQFDYDLTWMAFFMDDQDRFYARYGGREDADPDGYLTKASLLRVMREVLRLHEGRDVQTSRYEPAGKAVRTPEGIAAHVPNATRVTKLSEAGAFPSITTAPDGAMVVAWEENGSISVTRM